MAQQTLKSLLGLSDKRKQVDLDLDQQVFQAPSVEAGRYRVAPPRYSKTNAATNIANALGRYAGPIAKQLGGIEDERQQEYTNIAEGTPTEILQAIQKGKLDPVQDQLNEYSSKLDSAERKKLLKFSENPNNYIRASRVVGDRLANQYQADFRENPELYASKKDENGDFIPVRDQMQQVRDELIKENNLTGYALRAFIESTAQFETEEELRLNKMQNDMFQAEVEYDTKSAMVTALNVGLTDDTKITFQQNWATLTGAMDIPKQIQLLKDVVTDTATVNPIAADTFLTILEENESFLTLGSGSEIENSLLTELGKSVDQIKEDNVNAIIKQEQIMDFALKKSFTEDENTLAQGGTLAPRELPNLQGNGTVTVDLSGVTDTVGLYDAYRLAFTNQHEDNTDRARIVSMLDQKKADLELKAYTFSQEAGLSSIQSDLIKTFSETVTIGNETVNAFGYGETELQSKVESYIQPYEAELEALYTDPTLSSKERTQQSKVLAQKAQADISAKVREDTQTMVTTRNTLKFENSVGLSATNNSYTTSIISSLQAKHEVSGLAFMSGDKALAITKPFVEETRESMRAILNAPLTDEELSSGNLAQIYANRQLAARDYLLESQEIFIAETRNQDDDDEEASTVTTEETETIEPRTLNTSGNYAPTGGRGRAARQKSGNYQSNIKVYEQRNRQAVKDGHADYLAYIRQLSKDDRDLYRTMNAARDKSFMGNAFTSDHLYSTSRGSFYSKNGFKRYYVRESYNHAATERLYEGNPAITIDELESGTFNGFRLGQVDVTKTVVLSPSMVINAEDNRELLTEYAVALGLDTDDNTLNTFIQTQASLMESRFSLNIYND
jgi:hypothetical protein